MKTNKPIHLIPDHQLQAELANRDKNRKLKRATMHRRYLRSFSN